MKQRFFKTLLNSTCVILIAVGIHRLIAPIHRSEQLKSARIPICDVEGKWGFINGYGEISIPCQWSEVEPFREDNIAWVKDENTSLWGPIDTEGRLISPQKWSYFEQERYEIWIEGIAWATDDQNKWQAINRRGEVVFDRAFQSHSVNDRFDVTSWDKSGWSEVQKVVNSRVVSSTFIDRNGEEFPGEWESLEPFENRLITEASTDQGYCVIDRKGRIILPPQQQYSFTILDGSENLICLWKTEESSPLEKAEKAAFINSEGALLYDYESFELEGKFGVRSKAKVVIPPDWDSIKFSYDGQIHVEKNGKLGAFDLEGNLIIPARWDSIDYNYQLDVFVVSLAGKKGFYQANGKLIVNPAWDDIDLPTDTAWPSNTETIELSVEEWESPNHFEGLVDRDGRVWAPVEWKHVSEYKPSLRNREPDYLPVKDGCPVFRLKNATTHWL